MKRISPAQSVKRLGGKDGVFPIPQERPQTPGVEHPTARKATPLRVQKEMWGVTAMARLNP